MRGLYPGISCLKIVFELRVELEIGVMDSEIRDFILSWGFYDKLN
jgi:hypothetical protein